MPEAGIGAPAAVAPPGGVADPVSAEVADPEPFAARWRRHVWSLPEGNRPIEPSSAERAGQATDRSLASAGMDQHIDDSRAGSPPDADEIAAWAPDLERTDPHLPAMVDQERRSVGPLDDPGAVEPVGTVAPQSRSHEHIGWDVDGQAGSPSQQAEAEMAEPVTERVGWPPSADVETAVRSVQVSSEVAHTSAGWPPVAVGDSAVAGLSAAVDSARPDGARADSAQPDGARADSAWADGVRADGARSDGVRAGGARTDGAWADSGRSEDVDDVDAGAEPLLPDGVRDDSAWVADVRADGPAVVDARAAGVRADSAWADRAEANRAPVDGVGADDSWADDVRADNVRTDSARADRMDLTATG